MKLNNLFALFFIFLFTSCTIDAPVDAPGKTPGDSLTDEKNVREINKHEDLNVAEFKAKITTAEPFQLLDVRTPEECAEGMLDNALAMDFYEDSFEAELNTLDPNVPVLVYCRSGGRSGKTMDILQSKGFVEVYNLDGGITAWGEAGEDIVK